LLDKGGFYKIQFDFYGISVVVLLMSVSRQANPATLPNEEKRNQVKYPQHKRTSVTPPVPKGKGSA